MISVIIPTLNAEASLLPTLASLLEANRQGLIREVIISDGGSKDATLQIAAEAGAVIVHGPKGRGEQLARGAAKARGAWLLFLHADTALEAGWEAAALSFCQGAKDRQAAVFRLRFDAPGWRPKLVALGANMRAQAFRLPYGDQGLLISRRHYDRLGGFAPLPLFEDVDMVRRIVRAGGREAVQLLPAAAITSARRYGEDGYFPRVLRNARCLRLYFKGVPPAEILEIYHGKGAKAEPCHHGQAAKERRGQDQAQP